MKDKIRLLLDSLSDEDKEILKARLEQREQKEEVEESKPKRVKQQIANKPVRSQKRVKQFVDDDDDDDEQPRQRRREKTPKTGKGKRPCSTQAVQLGKSENIFEKSPDFNADKFLVKEDKALWKGKQPQPRIRVSLVEIECVRCHNLYTVSEKLAVKGFVCDDCITPPQ